jgi:hypothetical protein
MLWSAVVFGVWSVVSFMGYGSQRLAEVISKSVVSVVRQGWAGSGPFGNLILLSGFLLLKT